MLTPSKNEVAIKKEFKEKGLLLSGFSKLFRDGKEAFPRKAIRKHFLNVVSKKADRDSSLYLNEEKAIKILTLCCLKRKERQDIVINKKRVPIEAFSEEDFRNTVGEYKTILVNHLRQNGKIYQDYSRTLTVTDGAYITFINSDGNLRIRKMSVEESEKLQTYGKGMTTIGLKEDGESYNISPSNSHKMIGNGVTSEVSKQVFEELVKDDLKKGVHLRGFSLFSGCGGLEHLFPNYTPVLMCENVEVRRDCLRENLKKSSKKINEIIIHDDVRNLDLNDTGFKKLLETKSSEENILTAGFPCQSWSRIGNGKGFDDDRGKLINDMFRVIGDLKPKYLLLENVKGILEIKHRDSFFEIISAIKELGYEVDFLMLNSLDFGIPQNRERVFIVGKKSI